MGTPVGRLHGGPAPHGDPVSEGGLVAEELPPVVVGVDDSDPSRAAMRWAADEAVREAIAPWRDRYPQVAVAETIVREHPVKALAKISADADLIVVAARGHTGARLGSVSHGLIHRAACPVVVVHPDDDGDVA